MAFGRNAVQRRAHRERDHPDHHKGIHLEKHKDYSLRAKDYNKKKAQLKSLRQKAASRNEDEFYFGMMSRPGAGTKLSVGRGWTGTVDGDRGNRALDVETVRLLKTQDMGALRTMRNVVAKEVNALRERVIMAGGAPDGAREGDGDEDEDEDDEIFPTAAAARRKPKKIVFADDVDDREQILHEKNRAADDVDMDDEEQVEAAEAEADRKAESLEKLQRKLRNARKKLKALTDAEGELDLQRAKMAKTASFTGITKSGKKIKARERKR